MSKKWAKSDYVVVAPGTSGADAVVAGTLAGTYAAPLLLTKYKRLSKTQIRQIRKLGTKRAVVVGSSSAVSKSVYRDLNKAGIKTSAISKLIGADRYNTARLVAARIKKLHGAPVRAFVLNIADTRDAIPVAAYAAASGSPILWTGGKKLSSASAAALRVLRPSETIVVGGTSRVSAAIMKKLHSPTRITGRTLGTRAAAVADFAMLHGLSNTNVILLPSVKASIGYSVIPYAARLSAPILWTGTKNLDAATKGYLGDHSSAIKRVVIGGSTNVVTRGVSASITPATKTTVNGDLHVLTSEESTHVTAVTANTVVVTLGVNSPLFAANQLIASGASAAAPYGFLRRVISASDGAGVRTYQTQPASLSDVFTRGSVDLQRPVETLARPASLAHSSLLASERRYVAFRPAWDIGLDRRFPLYDRSFNSVLYDRDGNSSTTGDQVTLSGKADASVGFSFNARFSWATLQEINYEASFDEAAKVELKAALIQWSANSSKMVWSTTLAPQTYTVPIPGGVLPVTIVPEVELWVGASGEICAGMHTSLNQSAHLGTGFKYQRDSGWSTFSNKSFGLTYEPPTFTASAHADAWAGPRLTLLFYGLAGPSAQLKAFARAKADIAANPWWEIGCGASAQLGMQSATFPVIGQLASHQFAPFDLYYHKIIDAGGSFGHGRNGSIGGYVKNAVSGAPVAAATVRISRSGVAAITANTDSNGRYVTAVPVGTGYTVKFSAPAYLPVTNNGVVVEPDRQTNLETVLQVDTSHAGAGRVGGTVSDAFTGEGVQGAAVTLRQGVNTRTGTPIASATTDDYGYWSVGSLPGGNYTAQVSKAGYATGWHTVVSVGGTDRLSQNTAISPAMPDSQVRVVLTWGDEPSDLDSHLTGPDAGGGRFHVYYRDRVYAENGNDAVQLDHDDTSSYGPETMTLYQGFSGVLRYSVHDYSDRYSTDSTVLRTSGATVRVFRGSTLVRTFSVPQVDGTLWTVFEMTFNDTNLSITPVDVVSYLDDTSAVTSAPRPGVTAQSDAAIIAGSLKKSK